MQIMNLLPSPFQRYMIVQDLKSMLHVMPGHRATVEAGETPAEENTNIKEAME